MYLLIAAVKIKKKLETMPRTCERTVVFRDKLLFAT